MQLHHHQATRCWWQWYGSCTGFRARCWIRRISHRLLSLVESSSSYDGIYGVVEYLGLPWSNMCASVLSVQSMIVNWSGATFSTSATYRIRNLVAHGPYWILCILCRPACCVTVARVVPAQRKAWMAVNSLRAEAEGFEDAKISETTATPSREWPVADTESRRV